MSNVAITPALSLGSSKRGWAPQHLFKAGDNGAIILPRKMPGVLGTRKNRLDYSRVFDNAAWSKYRTTVAPSPTASPLGGQMTRLTNTGLGAELVQPLENTPVDLLQGNYQFTFSCYAKQVTGRYLCLQLYRYSEDATSDYHWGEFLWAYFDLETGQVTVGGSSGEPADVINYRWIGSSSENTWYYDTGNGYIPEETFYPGNGSCGMEDIGNGVWRCWITMQAQEGDLGSIFENVPPMVYHASRMSIFCTGDPAVNWENNNGLTMDIDGAQFEISPSLTEYEDITNANAQEILNPGTHDKRNWFNYSRNFANAFWQKYRITLGPNDQPSPLGGMMTRYVDNGNYAGLWGPTSSGGFYEVPIEEGWMDDPQGKYITFSAYLKAGTATHAWLGYSYGLSTADYSDFIVIDFGTYFDLVTGKRVPPDPASLFPYETYCRYQLYDTNTWDILEQRNFDAQIFETYKYGIEPVGDGVYRCWYTARVPDFASLIPDKDLSLFINVTEYWTLQAGLADMVNRGTTTPTGSYLFFDGFQLEFGNRPTPYQDTDDGSYDEFVVNTWDEYARMFRDDGKASPAWDDGDFVGYVVDHSRNGTDALQADDAKRAILRFSAGGKPYLEYGVGAELVVSNPDLGSNATVARSLPGTGASILTGQTVGPNFVDSTNSHALVLIDRPLTVNETSMLTAWLNRLAGV